MKTPLVLCTGMMRSGSTWSFNVCRLLAQIAAKQVNKPFWAGYLTLEQTEQFLAQTRGVFPGPTIVKAHGIGAIGQQMLRSNLATAVCTFRDPRDCVASLITFSGDSFELALSRVREGLQMIAGYPAPQTLFIRYEQMLQDRLQHVRNIATHLEIDADEPLLRRIDELTGIERSKQVMADLHNRPKEKVIEAAGHRVDPQTWLHENHIQSGKPERWREEFNTQQIAALNEQFAPWLTRLGYGT